MAGASATAGGSALREVTGASEVGTGAEHDSRIRRGAALTTGAGIGGASDAGISEGASSQTGRIDAGMLAAVRGETGDCECGPREARIELGPIDLGLIELGPIELGPIDSGAIEFGFIDSGAIDNGAMLSDGSEPGAPALSKSGSNECGNSEPSGGPMVGNA
jgi:hypothetical protein